MGQRSGMTPEPPMGIGMDTFRRVIAWERRIGKPANRAMVRFYEWVFVVIGPFAFGFGLFALIRGFWVGGVMVLLGLWWSWIGWGKLFRFVRLRVGRQD